MENSYTDKEFRALADEPVISADGKYAIVGAHHKTGAAGSYQGAAYIFIRSGTTWTQQAKLLAGDPAASDQFGYSVSISSDGSYAVVGAYYKTGTYTSQGAAYVFARSGTTWAQQAKLVANDPSTADFFGYSAAISSDGSYVVVGAHYKTGAAGSYQGAAYIFLRSGTTWAQQAKLLASDAAAYDYFGRSVAISSDGGYVLVGAFNKKGTHAIQGAAYIFIRSGATWAQQAKLLASDAAAYNYFGRSVSISSDGQYAVVGAYSKAGAAVQQGAAYVFIRAGTTWRQILSVMPGDDDDYRKRAEQ